MISAYQKWKYQTMAPRLMSVMMRLFGDRDRSDDKGRGLFFITGSGRNGSTLLASLINNHPALFSPPEQYVVPYYGMRWQLNRLESEHGFKESLIQRFEEVGITSNWQVDSENLKKLVADKTSYAEVIKSIFEAYGKSVGKKHLSMVGDNSPLTTHHLKSMHYNFSKSKYIFLVRDPRDVVLSYSKFEGHAAQKLNYAIWKWEDSLHLRNWLQKKDAQLITLKYEDMVSVPQESMACLFKFLGVHDIDITNQIPDTQALGVSDLSHHQNLKSPINTQSIGKWKLELPKQKVETVNAQLSRYYNEFGYSM